MQTIQQSLKEWRLARRSRAPLNTYRTDLLVVAAAFQKGETAVNRVTRKAVQTGTKANVWLYQRTNGQLGGRGIGRLPLLLLTVPGRSTGRPHTVPVAYLDHNDGWIVVGTGMGGSRRTPQWFLNLEAAGRGRVQIGARKHDVTARLPTSAERGTLWPHVTARAPHFGRWQARTGRTLPMIILTSGSEPS